MKVLLINPKVREWAKPNCLPLGLGYIAQMLSMGGHDVEVLDINALRLREEEVSRRIRASDYDIVGLGGMVTIYKEVKKIARICKGHHPDKLVVAGGSVATSIPKTLLEKTEVDIVCIGEGEITALELVNTLGNLQPLNSVRGIWFKNEKGEIVANEPRQLIRNLDKLPFPSYHLFPIDTYLKNPIGWLNLRKWESGKANEKMDLSINISSSRGCVFNCIYCYHDFMGARYRKRSPMNIIKEVEFLIEKYGVNYFHFIDDNFVTFKKNVFEFCRLVLERGLDVKWGCSGRINSMDKKLLLAMKEAGCRFITYGIESGSQKMLDVMKKKVRVEKVKKVLGLTMEHIDMVSCTFIVGTPGENRKTIQESIDFCKDLNLTPEAIFFMTPYPGTELYQMALDSEKLSIETEEEFVMSLSEQGEQLLVNFSELSDQELIELKWKMAEELGAQNLKKHVLSES